jgi:HEAT repeat protein
MPLIRSTAATEDLSTAVVTIDRTKLRADLESSDEDVRRAAVRLATRVGDAEVLAGHLEDESDAGLRETILTSLVRIGGVKAARLLIPMLRTDDARLRNALIETLQSMGEEVAPEIERLLDDENPDQRIYAVNIIHSMRSPRAPDIALRVIDTDPHVNVCAAAVDVLAEVGRPEMVDELRAVANRFPDHPFLAFAVRAAIKRIG